MSTFTKAVAASLAFCASLAIARALPGRPEKTGQRQTSVDKFAEQDAHLQKLTGLALGKHEGAIVVIDPQTGRVRAAVNPSLVFHDAFPPGSTIKPFTALAA